MALVAVGKCVAWCEVAHFYVRATRVALVNLPTTHV